MWKTPVNFQTISDMEKHRSIYYVKLFAILLSFLRLHAQAGMLQCSLELISETLMFIVVNFES